MRQSKKEKAYEGQNGKTNWTEEMEMEMEGSREDAASSRTMPQH